MKIPVFDQTGLIALLCIVIFHLEMLVIFSGLGRGAGDPHFCTFERSFYQTVDRSAFSVSVEIAGEGTVSGFGIVEVVENGNGTGFFLSLR